MTTILPEAHPFAEPAEGTRCADCQRRRSHGVHKVQALPHNAMRARRRTTYRTSSTPHLARQGWAR